MDFNYYASHLFPCTLQLLTFFYISTHPKWNQLHCPPELPYISNGHHIHLMQYIHMKLSVFYFRIESLSNDIPIYVHSIGWAQWRDLNFEPTIVLVNSGLEEMSERSVTVVYYYIAVRRWQACMFLLFCMYLINVGRICLSIQNDEFQPWRKNNYVFKVEIHHILYLNINIYMYKMYMELYRGA